MLVASRVLAALWLGEWVGGEKQYINCTLFRRRRLVQGAADQWCSQPDHHAQTLSAASRARFCLGAASVAGDEDCRAGDLCQCTRLHGRDAQRHRLHRWQWPQRAVCLRARSAWRRSARREARIDSSGAMPEDNLTCRFCFGGVTAAPTLRASSQFLGSTAPSVSSVSLSALHVALMVRVASHDWAMRREPVMQSSVCFQFTHIVRHDRGIE